MAIELQNRSSGILLHITALPSPYGIGDFGSAAYEFVDKLTSANQSLWQILPLGMADKYGCPYSCLSAFGGNTLLISPEKLVEEELLHQSDLNDLYNPIIEKVDFNEVKVLKNKVFKKAYQNFHINDLEKSDDYQIFLKNENDWIEDFSIFSMLSNKYGIPWSKWPKDYKFRDTAALKIFKEENIEEYHFQLFLQYSFFKQLNNLKDYANQNNISLIGDIPIFIAYHSMDVWREPKNFKLNSSLEMEIETGVPPDCFSTEGQKWGNPNFNWNKMKDDDFSWWISRIEHSLKQYNIVRLDHFIGFSRVWEVPVKDLDAKQGNWVATPGTDLFTKLEKKLGKLPLIAEDLGEVNDNVIKLRDDFDLPGMKILQFAFGTDESNENLPLNYTKNSIIYTGTHDNQTVHGWFDSLSGVHQKEKDNLAKLLKKEKDENLHWDFIELAFDSIANTVITPLQDIMGQSTEGRFNTPGTIKNNWVWRFSNDQLLDSDLLKLKDLTNKFKRCND